MALAYSTDCRNDKLDAITTRLDAGAGAALLEIYNAPRPATGGATTTLLAQLPLSDPAAPAASGGVLTLSVITDDSSADAAGDGSWFRLTDSNGVFVIDGDVGTSGSDLNLDNISIAAGQVVGVSSFTITEANS